MTLEIIKSKIRLHWKVIFYTVQVMYGVCTLLVPVLVAILTASPKQEANVAKHLKVTEISHVNQLQSLRTWEGGGKPQFKIGGQDFANVTIYTAIVQNTGLNPILPSDIHEPLSLNVQPPWEIITVESLPTPQRYIALTWRKESATKFSAVPSLLNSGDACLVTAYLTNPSKDLSVDVSTTNESLLSWGIRVTGLNEISLINKNLGNSDLVKEKITELFQAFQTTYVLLTGKKLIVTWTLAIINFALLAHLLIIRGDMKLKPWKATCLIVFAAALSAGCSECIATYIYSDPVVNMMEYFFSKYDLPLNDWPKHLYNLPPIIAYVATLAFFLWAPRYSKRKQRIRSHEPI